MNNYLFGPFERFKPFESFESFVSFVSFVSFKSMWLNMYSFNSLCEKDFNIFSNRMNLFLRGFNAAYLLFFNWTMYALLALSFSVRYIFLLSSSNIFNEILELFVSNSVGVMWMKLYCFSNSFSYDVLSGWKEMS